MLLKVGHQQVLTAAIPGQTIGFRSDCDLVAELIRHRVQHEHFGGPPRRRENERIVTLGAQHSAAFRASG